MPSPQDARYGRQKDTKYKKGAAYRRNTHTLQHKNKHLLQIPNVMTVVSYEPVIRSKHNRITNPSLQLDKNSPKTRNSGTKVPPKLPNNRPAPKQRESETADINCFNTAADRIQQQRKTG
jgi:hypothetical protein